MIAGLLFLLGTAAGSFALAVVWRLYQGRDFVTERSECEYCHHTLAPADLIPIASWLLLRGRCRYCHLKLSWYYPVVEALTGFLFVLSYLWWPGDFQVAAEIASFCFWLVYLTGLVILFLYDLRWQLLPDKIVLPLIWLAALEVVIIRVWVDGQGLGAVVEAGGGVALLSGFFGFLYLVSKGRWIGFGDVKLGVLMGLVLGLPGALIALFGSYYLAAAIILPLLPLGKVHKKSRVPFGPFLLAAFFLSYLFSDNIVQWWQEVVLG